MDKFVVRMGNGSAHSPGKRTRDNGVAVEQVSVKKSGKLAHVHIESSGVNTASATTTTTASLFLQPNKFSIDWTLQDGLLKGVALDPPGRTKVAAFDFDGTLVTTKSGNVHAKDSEDWKWWHSSIPKKLRQLYDEGHKIVVFTNQAGLKTPQRIASFKSKLQSCLSQINIPIQIFACVDYSQFRKPITGFWQKLVRDENQGVAIDVKASLFVGDAAGRPAGWKKGARKDFSCTDRKFAQNVGLSFLTPEEYFLGEAPAPFSWGDFDPKSQNLNVPLFTPTSIPLLPNPRRQELILFVGYPASGKSTFAKRYLLDAGYAYVNQDTLKTRVNCLAACEKAMSEGSSCVIDNTNPDPASRGAFLAIAKSKSVPTRCFWFQASEGLARHNNYYRAYSGLPYALAHPTTQSNVFIPENYAKDSRISSE
ncbi:hypothetical protein BZG36_03584 [Bifiguratus adelaidae]|uniref:Polynucleotide kinase 3'-phosphatase n=1 Tax=Bifiguratus adelaidae TaxID=1938954 RepID=A0A261XYI1_9FUNG|nr:hypothetical protein BZG36_03584 [Bifiguratus adelaidae]